MLYDHCRAPDLTLGDRLLSSAGAGRSCALPMRLPNPNPALNKNLTLVGPEMFSSTGAGSGGRLLRHFQTPVLYWTNFSLRKEQIPANLGDPTSVVGQCCFEQLDWAGLQSWAQKKT